MLCCLRSCLALLLAATAVACSVPVFSYALGNWPPENHRLRLDPAGRAALAALGREPMANLEVVDPQAGGMAVEIEVPGTSTTWWRSGPEGLATALASPARARLATALVGGESLVWIVVRSGTPRDAEVETLLRKRLDQLQASLELPPQTDPGPPAFNGPPGPALRLSFAIITVDRADPAERGLVAQIEAQLPAPAAGAAPVAGPLLAAVLGRGRMLEVLAGETIDEARIEGICLFACGPCSCQVKEANPGVDLLISVDWEAELTRQAQAQAAPAAAPAVPAAPLPAQQAPAQPKAAPQVVRFEPPPATPAPPLIPSASAPPWWIWAAVAAVAAAALALLAYRRRR